MSTVLSVLDACLDWLLVLPRDLAIVFLAAGTSVGMTLVRKFVTNQELLGRCSRDLARLKALGREARAAGDTERLARIRQTTTSVKLLQLSADGRVLLVAILPLALLSWWGVERLEYIAPRPGTDLTFRAEYRPSAAGRLTHMVPPEGLPLVSPAICVVGGDAPAHPQASWTLRADAPIETDITIRCQGKSVTQRIRAGSRTMLPPFQEMAAGPIVRTWIDVEQYRSPLTRWAGRDWLPAPEWVWFYLLITLALMPVTRRLLRTY